MRSSNHISVVLGLILIASLIWISPTLTNAEVNNGNDPNVAVPPAAALETEVQQTSGQGHDTTLMTLVLESGWTGLAFMAVLALFSLVAATVAIERSFGTSRTRILPSECVLEIRQLTEKQESNPERFREICSKWTNPFSKILNAGLLRSGRPVTEVEKAMEDAAAREMAEIRGGIRPLTVIGSIAPLVGLLGTVLGMIIAFRTASQAGLGKGELMAQGIYMALLTTAAGLSIAIPSLLLAAWFQTKVEKFFREIDRHLMQTIPCFARMEKSK